MEIVGYSNYLIYEDGRVYSKYYNKFLNIYKNRYNYSYVNLYNDKKRKHFTIHRLVALHYIPNPENKLEVDHKNRNKEDNRVENLRWATSCENNQNKAVTKRNKLGIKNISKHQSGYRYHKVINGKDCLKYFKTLEEAIQFKKEFELTEPTRQESLL